MWLFGQFLLKNFEFKFLDLKLCLNYTVYILFTSFYGNWWILVWNLKNLRIWSKLTLQVKLKSSQVGKSSRKETTDLTWVKSKDCDWLTTLALIWNKRKISRPFFSWFLQHFRCKIQGQTIIRKIVLLYLYSLFVVFMISIHLL